MLLSIETMGTRQSSQLKPNVGIQEISIMDDSGILVVMGISNGDEFDTTIEAGKSISYLTLGVISIVSI